MAYKVFIDTTFPARFHKLLKQSLSGVDTEAEADLIIMYAHDEVNPHVLSAYKKYKESASYPKDKKILFLCWYDWKENFEELSQHFEPDASCLWNKKYYRHVPLPVSIEDLQKELLLFAREEA